MSWHQRWRNVFRPEPLNAELDTELQFHLAETVDRLMESGMSADEALQHARLRLGNYTTHKERTRDMNVAAWLDTTRADLLYGMRQLKLSPGFAAVAILSLALGIGANTAMFQLVDAIQLRMLPVRDPQQLVTIDFQQGSARGGWWSSRSANFTYAQLQEVRTQQQAFSGVIAWSASRFNLTKGGEPRFAEGLFVSGNFFDELGVQATLGRTLTSQDDTTPCNAGAVLSHAFWQREFGGDPKVLGREVSLNGLSLPVIGVTPPSFFGVEVGNRYDVAIPLCTDPLIAEDKKGRIPLPAGWWLSFMGRLKPGWTAQSANTHLHTISPSIMQATLPPEYKPDFAKKYLANKLEAKEPGIGVSGLRRQYTRPLWLLMATTGLVLLIACANLANLLLARATAREPEIALRLAIGASRWRLVRQLLGESLLLASAGAVLGVAIALILSRTLISFIGTSTSPVFVDTTLDWRVIGFTAGLAVLTCVLFGLLPALRATYFSPASALRAGGRSVTASRERFGVRRALVVTQVALSLVLLVGAILFARSLHNLMTTEVGFAAQGVLTINVDFSKLPYPKEQRQPIYKELAERLTRVPGVVSVAQVGITPVSGSSWDNLIGPDGSPAAGSGKESLFNRAAPGYFQTMGTRLLAGREFNEHDTRTSQKVAIVNKVFADKFFGGANPVGRTFHLEAAAGKPEPLFQIVGLVANTKYFALREEFSPIAFFPIAQDEEPGPNAIYVMRINGTPGGLMMKAKQAIAEISPMMTVEFRPLSTQLEDSLRREQLMASLSVGFGMLAGLLAALGLYGVISYMVARRRSEIGVRIALGADRIRVIRLVLGEAILLLTVGLAAGGVIAVWAGQAASSLLFGLRPNDTISLAAAGALLTIITLLACYLPARRAASLDPITTLRSE